MIGILFLCVLQFMTACPLCPRGYYEHPYDNVPCKECPVGRLAAPAGSTVVEDCPVDPCSAGMLSSDWRDNCDYTRCYAGTRCCASSPSSTGPDGFCISEYTWCLWDQETNTCYAYSPLG